MQAYGCGYEALNFLMTAFSSIMDGVGLKPALNMALASTSELNPILGYTSFKIG